VPPARPSISDRVFVLHTRLVPHTATLGNLKEANLVLLWREFGTFTLAHGISGVGMSVALNQVLE